ncbi:MAG TPA: haloacid dehalogenase type II [Casimicrobiaceae bacterium]|nr:haloacid dehalogenase type II [Casimicrobiaceae bacterium]
MPVPKALVFDVFGTVVDWRGSIIREARRIGRSKAVSADWAAFADAWHAGYRPALDRVRRGELPWTKLDGLHRMILDELLLKFRLRLSEREKRDLNFVWHRLAPWPDAVRGLTRLKRHYCIGTLSNGNVAILVDMARHARLPWDCIISAELFQHYKPDPEVYRGAADLLGLAPREVMLVAAHKYDLAAARKCGLKTAFVRRPLEHGPGSQSDIADDPRCTFNADDFIDLARQMRA